MFQSIKNCDVQSKIEPFTSSLRLSLLINRGGPKPDFPICDRYRYLSFYYYLYLSQIQIQITDSIRRQIVCTNHS